MGRTRTLHVMVCAFALVGLSGCLNYSSPKGIVGSAYKALSKNDTKSFTKTLKGDAMDRFGNLEGMIALQRDLAGLEVKVDKVTLVSTDRVNRRMDLEKYTVDVVGRQRGSDEGAMYAPAMTIKVECEFSWNYSYEPYMPAHLEASYYPGHPGYGFDRHWHGHPGRGHMVREENRSCLISAIEL